MDVLGQVIDVMNKEEVRHFKIFTSRTQSSGDRKDLRLFDFIRSGGKEYEEDKILSELYPRKSKNAFYRLKNRLLTEINKSLVLQHLESDDNLQLFHLLSLARFFRSRNHYQVAFYYVKKAEKRAISLENYELLDFIYGEMIQLSQEIISINPEEYIRRRKENREKLHVLQEIDDILAAVIYRLKVTQNFSSKENPLFELLEKTVSEYAQNPAIAKNPKLRITTYKAVSRILLSRKEYIALEEYLLKMFREFSNEGLFTKTTHEIKLQMLVYLVNTLYKNRKIDQSLLYCEKLRQSMDEYGGAFYERYLLYYYNGLVINYTKRDPAKCIDILSNVLEEGTFKRLPFYEFLFQTNLSVSYYNVSAYSKALRTLVRAFIHEGFQLADNSLKLRISVFEMILRMEIDDQDTIDKKLERVRKEYSEQLSDPSNAQEKVVLEILQNWNNSPSPFTEKKLYNKIKSHLNSEFFHEQEDFSFIDYQEWLRQKFRIPTSVSA